MLVHTDTLTPPTWCMSDSIIFIAAHLTTSLCVNVGWFPFLHHQRQHYVKNPRVECVCTYFSREDVKRWSESWRIRTMKTFHGKANYTPITRKCKWLFPCFHQYLILLIFEFFCQYDGWKMLFYYFVSLITSENKFFCLFLYFVDYLFLTDGKWFSSLF